MMAAQQQKLITTRKNGRSAETENYREKPRKGAIFKREGANPF
jgi:hypothetical protein